VASALVALGFAVATSGSTNEAQFLSNIRQLIYEGRRSGEGYYSPDGKFLIFQSEREEGNPFYQIYTLDLENGDSRRVSPGTGKTTCGFFRPGTDEVLFASTHLDPEALARQKQELEFRASGQTRRYSWDYDETMDIFLAHRDGSGVRPLTTTRGYDAEGAFSPDGRQIVFCSLRHAYDRTLSAEEKKRLETDPSWFGEIYLMNADGSGQQRLTTSPGYDGGPFFSPDGQRILWRRFDDKGVNADVFTMKLDGSDARQLTDFGAMSWAPFFHPSGEYVIFTANKLGFSNFELFLVDAMGRREPARVTFTDGFDGLPVFSPNGRQLSWTSGRTADGKSQIFLADWNHAAAMAALAKAELRKGPIPIAERGAPAPEGTTTSPFSAEIESADLRQQVGYLASEPLEGRMTGSRGSQLAADYIAKVLEEAGAEPAGENGTWFQTFSFNSGVRVITNETRLVLHGPGEAKRGIELDQDFRPLSFSTDGSISGEVVFAGYGLSVPGKPGEGYDSYAGLNLSNKIALVLRYVPESVTPKRRQELNRYAGLRYKAMLARERGALGILFVTGPNSPNAGELAALSVDTSVAGSGLPAASVTARVAELLLEGTGKSLRQIQSDLDVENPHAEGAFAIPRKRLEFAVKLERLRKNDRNVLGRLPPADGASPSEWVIVGAHYDHLGLGETGAMLRSGEERQIHFGADDNASGTAAVLELAAALNAERKARPEMFRRGVLFALWSGEELGLIGSSHFAEHPVVALSNVTAYVNFDMVGRLRENKLNLQGVGSSALWRRLIEKRNVPAGFNLVLQEDPYLPTDVTAFYPRQVPVLNFFTGGHEDYHRPTDRPDTLNYEGLERITRFSKGLVLDLASSADRPDYVKVARSDTGGSRENLRAYLGTIPDYATEVSGVKISGTRGGSPAEMAGLKSGDVIVEFAGQKIANIYDYTYALDAVKIGQPVEIVVLREGRRVKVSATPIARK
jgi:Tol biopolymer transport system component